LKRLILAALLSSAAFAFPAVASADSPICHDGILSNDVGQGCTNDGAYGGAPTGSTGSSDPAICHDGILSDDAGQGCADGLYEATYGSGSAPLASASSASHHSSYSSTSYSSSGGGYSNVPGVPASFAACVAMRESTNGAGSSNIYGIQGPGGQGSLASQKAAFSQMYHDRGSQPWSPYDGC
jgi:hypothetical protein